MEKSSLTRGHFVRGVYVFRSLSSSHAPSSQHTYNTKNSASSMHQWARNGCGPLRSQRQSAPCMQQHLTAQVPPNEKKSTIATSCCSSLRTTSWLRTSSPQELQCRHFQWASRYRCFSRCASLLCLHFDATALPPVLTPISAYVLIQLTLFGLITLEHLFTDRKIGD